MKRRKVDKEENQVIHIGRERKKEIKTIEKRTNEREYYIDKYAIKQIYSIINKTVSPP